MKKKLVGGGYIAPPLDSEWNAQAAAAASQAGLSAPGTAGQKPVAFDAYMEIPMRNNLYWRDANAQYERDRFLARKQRKEKERRERARRGEDEDEDPYGDGKAAEDGDNEDEERATMSEGDSDDDAADVKRYDSHGIELPRAVEEIKMPEKVPVEQLFSDIVAQVEPDWTPCGVTDQAGLRFRTFFPDNRLGRHLRDDLLFNVSAVAGVSTHRFGHSAEQYVGACNVLPSPCHTSPLLCLMLRDGGARRYTDGISSLVHLNEIVHAIAKLDTAIPEHKKQCLKFMFSLSRMVERRFYDKVEFYMKCIADRPADVSQRDHLTQILLQFGKSCDTFTLDRIHVAEWCIMDMLRVPFKLRSAFMTPTAMPTNVNVLLDQSFSVLRVNLCRYTRNRNEIYCSEYSTDVDPKTGRHRILGIAADAHNPMKTEEPKLEDRLFLLRAYDPKNTNPIYKALANKVAFGLYNDWIDLHTLGEWLYLLSNDPRQTVEKIRDRRKNGKVLTEQEETILAAAKGKFTEEAGPVAIATPAAAAAQMDVSE